MPRSVDPRLTHGAWLLAVGAAVGLTWQTQFVPDAQQLGQTIRRFGELREQVRQTDQLFERAGGEAAWAVQLQTLLTQISTRFPQGDQVPQLLDALIEEVARAGLEVVNVQQGNLKPVTDAQGMPVQMSGAFISGLPVILTVNGSFHQVIAYLEALTSTEFPCVAKVESVRMAVDDPAEVSLLATLEVVLYAVGM